VILVTRLNGAAFALNPDLIERADCTPDTIVTLLDGTKYIITESLATLIDLVRDYRASVIAHAQYIQTGTGEDIEEIEDDIPDSGGKVVQLHRRER
jgi:flagellar protein FlbD